MSAQPCLSSLGLPHSHLLSLSHCQCYLQHFRQLLGTVQSASPHGCSQLFRSRSYNFELPAYSRNGSIQFHQSDHETPPLSKYKSCGLQHCFNTYSQRLVWVNCWIDSQLVAAIDCGRRVHSRSFGFFHSKVLLKVKRGDIEREEGSSSEKGE